MSHYGENATVIFNQLLNEGIVGAQTSIAIDMLGIQVVLKAKDPVGVLLQSWLAEWLIDHGYPERIGNSQEFPDFYLTENHEDELLELKCFDASSNPNFDIANFDAYCSSLETKPYRLDADYLVFSYHLNPETGIITIDGIWLKKIWEMSTSDGKYPIKIQVKKDVPYNLRPAGFNSPRNLHVFGSKAEFIVALFEAIKLFKGVERANQWLKNFREARSNFYSSHN